MSKSHRDNYIARKKRGPAAAAKKKERRAIKSIKCNICGKPFQPASLVAGQCPQCFNRQLGPPRNEAA